MTRATDCLDQLLKHLHETEDKIEHENMLHPDHRLTLAELALHRCITDVERAQKGQHREFDHMCTTDSYGAPR